VAQDPYDVVRAMARQVSNWGRWGADDERGTLNLIDRAAARRGAAAVQTGAGFTLGLPMSLDGPQCGLPPERFNPRHYMTAIGQPAGEHPGFHFSDDVITLPPQCATQCDALSHVHYDGKLYNGFDADEVLTEKGASRLGIDKQATQALATRGLLLDFPRLWGVDRLAPGTPITAQHLDDAIRRSDVEVEPGDALLLRTGHLNVFLEDGDRQTYNFTAPGLTLSAVPWLRERDVAFVASDTTLVEVLPAEDPRLTCPLHLLLIRDMGMPLGEMYNLELLAQACAADGRWDFFFTAQPIAIKNGIGSPTNPIAIR
jgi:kynurenine formamidase